MIDRMKHLVLFASAAVLWAQAPEGVPAPSNVRGAQYPRILPDRRVVFQIKAPAAQKVQVMPGGGSNGMGKGPFDMSRAEDGTWTATIGPVAPGFHYYWLLVDGVPANDPGSETFFGWSKQSSALEIPDPALDFYDYKDVPHGDVRVHWYRSRVTGQPRRAFVYMPPSYDADARTRYPVLYLQHGAGESERVDGARPREFHPGQPACRKEGGTHDCRDGQRVCHRRDVRGCRAQGPDPGD
jgi:hypothetical protein